MTTNYSVLDEIRELFSINAVSAIDYKTRITNISTDTRTIQPGAIFIAIVGDRFDGHKFINNAIEKEAIAVVYNKNETISWVNDEGVCKFPVDDTIEAYQKIGNWWRNKFINIPVIAVTGSVGKTTTKEIISAMLSSQGKILKSIGNINNCIGVPQTILKLESDFKFAVLEFGMDGRGQIASYTKCCYPIQIGVITTIGTAHIGRLGSELAICEAKCELLAGMSPDGVAIINSDNQLLVENYSRFWKGKTITFGFETGEIRGEYRGDQIQVGEYLFQLPLPGKHNAANFLAGLAVMKALNIPWSNFAQGVAVSLPPQRSVRIALPQDIIFMDETYNASTQSVLATISLLKEIPGKRHIAVIGSLRDLGDQSASIHHALGKDIDKIGIDLLVVLAIDPPTVELANGAVNTKSLVFYTSNDLEKYLNSTLVAGDRVLFKASNTIGLLDTVNRVKDHFQTLHASQ